jgi:hypothetical protein
MSQPREPHEDPTTEYVRSALHEAAQSYRPGRTAMVDRVAAGRAAPPRPAPRRRPRAFLRMHPVGAAVAVAAILTVSMIAVRAGGDHDQPAAAPRSVPTTAAAEPSTGPPSRLAASARPAANGYLSTKGALDPHSVTTWAQQNVTITNTKKLKSLRVTITVAASAGTSSTGKFTTVPNSDLTMTVTQAANTLTYLYALHDGATLAPGKYVFAAQFNHRAGRATDQDSYTVVAGTGKAEAQLAGGF